MSGWWTIAFRPYQQSVVDYSSGLPLPIGRLRMPQGSPAHSGGGPVRRLVAQRRHAPDGAVLALAGVGPFMGVLDVSIVTVALPSVGHDLHYTASGLQCVVNAYVLTFAGFLLF